MVSLWKGVISFWKRSSILNLKCFPNGCSLLLKRLRSPQTHFSDITVVWGLVDLGHVTFGFCKRYISVTNCSVPLNQNILYLQWGKIWSVSFSNEVVSWFLLRLILCVYRELVEELHPLMKEALERRPEVAHAHTYTPKIHTHTHTHIYIYINQRTYSLYPTRHSIIPMDLIKQWPFLLWI